MSGRRGEALLAIAVVTWSALMTSSSSAEMAEKRLESVAKKLYDDKLAKSNYNKLIRPVGNTSESLTVEIGLRLTSIIDVVSFITVNSHTYTAVAMLDAEVPY